MLRLPPLNAIRVFEAAGRHLSFKSAAAELCVTPGAVSRHVLNLEQHLGERLFDRHHREVRLTALGELYLATVRRTLTELSDATEACTVMRAKGLLRLKVPPTFATLWLVPRLARLKAQHPDLTLQITTSHDQTRFAADEIDAAVGYGGDFGVDIQVDRLFGEVMVPIVAPARDGDVDGPVPPEQLVRRTLLHSSHRLEDWERWFEAAGLGPVNRNEGLVFENSSLTFRGAIEGVGVALTQVAFALDELDNRRLVIPCDIHLRDETAYVFAVPRARLRDARVQRFRNWVIEEARTTRERGVRFLI
ncbi:LysR family transcriptional regulator [Bosea caraganae]|uniref:LysR family transcriptional regulator n=1 Tax=Bosea caraganae TaxID=2763117 RepID=A0A370LD97_9HYPH|nr:LysR substrate-binding domain-containing protein [Bosea caraganae]RDJ27806.1 LysR family transcriptional regulator [Bosea caraganae]RDJ29819.1 LysR family transcriptional regulator [Bosea caraganae]